MKSDYGGWQNNHHANIYPAKCLFTATHCYRTCKGTRKVCSACHASLTEEKAWRATSSGISSTDGQWTWTPITAQGAMDDD